MRCVFLLFLLSVVYTTSTSAQVDFRRDWAFFQSRQVEYQTWLSLHPLGRFFQVKNLQDSPDKLILHLESVFTGKYGCDSLRAAWRVLRKQYYLDAHQVLHTTMLEKFCFQMDLPLDSAEILINCPGSSYQIRIFGEYSGHRLVVRSEETGDETMNNGIIPIAVGQLKNIYRGGRTQLEQSSAINIGKVRQAVVNFLYQRYQSKGTPYIWDAHIDTILSYSNDLTYQITHISGEILKDRGFFEYHRVNIKIEQINDMLNISWNFSAKYGGGLIYPPRKNSNDYHDIETSPFKDQFDEYQKDLCKKLKELLTQL